MVLCIRFSVLEAKYVNLYFSFYRSADQKQETVIRLTVTDRII